MRKRHGIIPGWILPAFVVGLCAYLFLCLIQYQVTLSSKQQQLQSIQAQLVAQKMANEELSRALEDGDTAIIERVAREQGYAKPNERIFIDISGK